MKKLLSSLLLIPLFALTGCYDNSSPTAVLKSIAVAVEKNDMKAYPKFFSGQAKDQYGNAQGMEVLRSKGISSKKSLKLSKAALVSERSTGNRAWNSIYRVDVLVEGNRVLANTQVSCDSQTRTEPGQQNCTSECSGSGSERHCWRTCTPGFPRDVTYSECALSDLRFR